MNIDLSNFSGFVVYENGQIVSTYTTEKPSQLLEESKNQRLNEENRRLIDLIFAINRCIPDNEHIVYANDLIIQLKEILNNHNWV